MEWMFDLYDYYKHRQNRFYYLSLLKNGDNWHIHGLWPQYTETNYPSYCKPVDFDIKKLFPILPALEKYWYSDDKKDAIFWKHEWEKHGSCVFTDINELKYFQTALVLYQQALDLNLPEKYYKNGKCLIPVDSYFKII